MKRKRFSEEQIIAILREHEAGVATADLCRKHGMSSASLYAWKAKFGGMDVSDAQKLRALEAENAKLRRLLAAQRREAVGHLIAAHQMSERRACRVASVERALVRYRSRRPDDAELRTRLRSLAHERRRFGYRRLHVLLRREGWAVNRKRVQRLYREERLMVRKRGGRKRALGLRAPLPVPDRPNACWSLDSVHDQMTDGRRFRVLVIVDDCTRECLGLVPDTSIKAYRANARERTREGVQAPLYDPADTAAWYILQAETFATNRALWTPEGMMRVVPFLTRIGKELPLLLSVKDVEKRAARIVLADRRQPDSGIYELLVALAYRRGGWSRVEFVPETPGHGRTPDLYVFRPRSQWAVECKRLTPSPYAAREKTRGMKLAAPVHALSVELNESIVLEVQYKIELSDVPDDYLVASVRSAIERRSLSPWNDAIASGCIRPVNWALTRKVLAKDYVYFGGSRMIELLTGQYAHDADHSMAAKWRPSSLRSEYADAVYQASVVTWWSVSGEAVRQKARHFRKTLADAEGQLPPDRPGVIHIGVESYAGANVDFRHHFLNAFEARFFAPKKSWLR